MRQIKFRAKRMDSNEWLFGSLFVDKNKHCYIKEPNGKLYFIEDKDTIGQFTGLKDKNGKEIYEGDILSIASESNKLFGVVMWHKEGYFCVEDHLSVSEPSDHISIGKLLRVSIFEFKVIGNIYDNLELLKK